jgi:hypothetical protein
MTIRARVFQKDGNRFLIPGYWCDEADENWQGMSVASILCDGMMLGVVCGLDSHQEWLDVESDADGNAALTHIPYQMLGQQFAHGGIDVPLISGPLFDESMKRDPALEQTEHAA